MAGRVIRGAVLPAAPHDPAPGAPEGPQRAGVVVAGAGAGVEVLRPGVVVASGVGQRADRSSPISANSSAAQITLRGLLNSDRKISPSGCSRSAAAIWRSSELICSLSTLIVATKHSTSARRVPSSSSPTRAAGAPRSFASSCADFGCLCSAPGPGIPAGALLPCHVRRLGWGSAQGTRARSGYAGSVNSPSGPGQNRSSSARGWLVNAVRAPTRSSRARVSARSALV